MKLKLGDIFVLVWKIIKIQINLFLGLVDICLEDKEI